MPPNQLAYKIIRYASTLRKRTACLFQLTEDTLSTEVVDHPYAPAVDDERTSYRSVEAVHLAVEGEERVGVLRGASVRPTREVQLTDTSHLARLLQHGADPGNTRAWV